jgi:hypothetical protein
VTFATGLSGSKVAQISAPPHRFVFRLYNTASIFPLFLDAIEVIAIGTGTITADPNPCGIASGSSVCTTTVTWSTSNVTGGQVTIEDSVGGEEEVFASGVSGSEPAQLQAPPHQYTLRLYDVSSGEAYLLAATTAVTTGSGGISVLPNPCPIPSGFTVCAAEVTWAAESVTAAQVTLEDAAGGGELFFASGVSGIETAFLQAPPHFYTFRLYDISLGIPFWLASTAAFASGSGTLAADPNPCALEPGALTCATNLRWTTENVSAAEVTVEDVQGGGEQLFGSGRFGSLDFDLEPQPHQYYFRLYDVSANIRVLLAATLVFATGQGGITATPNPCVITGEATSCTSNITWSAPGTSLAEVTVQDAAGGGELLFATGVSGSQDALIEAPPHRYTFRLYDTFNGRVQLGHIEVIASGTGAIMASPNPCPVVSPATSCAATITWSTANVGAAEITVEDEAVGGETVFASGLSGEETAQIQVPPHEYTFRLYDISSGTRLFLAATSVLGTGTGTITAEPNPCQVPAGSTTCLANLSWNTENVSAALITREDLTGGGEVPFTSGVSGSENILLEAPPHQYVFRLYDVSTEYRVFLNAVTVLTEGAPITVNAPSNLTAVAGKVDNDPRAIRFVDLSWQDNSDNEDSFVIQRCLLSGRGRNAGCAFSDLASVGANVTTYHDATVLRNTNYRYRVRAQAGTVGSAYSNVVQVKTP